jgi:coniferyl-aldehyde dehydrogenase
MIPTGSDKSEEDGLHLIFALQRAASRSTPAPTFERRRAALEKLRDLVRTNATAIASAISADFGGRSKSETELLEIVPTLSAIRHTRRYLRSWMRPERRPVDITFQPARAWVQYEPLGVVGIVAPWNYPLLLTISPLLDAIAAGNRAMLKPSELTPRFSELLRVIIAVRYDPSEIAVITGGVEIARSFTSLPFDHLFFTGSTAVGRQVMRAAAENLTPVTLELGGKSSAIVCPDYPVEKAARSIAFGKFLNAGQTCIAPDYVLVPSEHCEAFAHRVLAEATRAYPTIAGNSDYTSIITEQHRRRLNAALDEARAAGATILSHADPNANAEGKLAPTIVLNAPGDGVLMREEIFGPILPVVSYRSLDDALAFINARSRNSAAHCAGRVALRRSWRKRHGRLSRPRWLPPHEPRTRRSPDRLHQRLRRPRAPLGQTRFNRRASSQSALTYASPKCYTTQTRAAPSAKTRGFCDGSSRRPTLG